MVLAVLAAASPMQHSQPNHMWIPDNGFLQVPLFLYQTDDEFPSSTQSLSFFSMKKIEPCASNCANVATSYEHYMTTQHYNSNPSSDYS
jgi:hypothetical protein